MGHDHLDPSAQDPILYYNNNVTCLRLITDRCQRITEAAFAATLSWFAAEQQPTHTPN